LSLILPHANYGNIVFTGADSASQRCCIHMRRRLDHVPHLESTVTGTLLVDNARKQLLSFFLQDTACSPSFLSVFSVSFCLICAHLELDCSVSSSACYESVINGLGCRAWNSLPYNMKRLPTHGRFVSALKGMCRLAWFLGLTQRCGLCVFVEACALLFCAISGPG
jgi:hypothetical protein